MSLERVLELIKNGEFKKVDHIIEPEGFINYYEVFTNNGGMIRCNKVCKVLPFEKDAIGVNLFVPDKEYSVASYRIKSNDDWYDDVYDAFMTIKKVSANNDNKFF